MQLTKEKVGFYLLGIITLTLGITLTIQSELGTSPFDALLVGLYRTIGLTIGSWEIVVGLTLVLLNALIKLNRPEYLALLTSLVTGVFIDFWIFLLRDWVTPNAIMTQYICLLLGIVLSGLGIAIYLQADFAVIPMDRTMLILRDITGLNVAYTRAIINVALVIVAFLFNGPIGIGTLLNAVFSGAIIAFFIPYISKFQANAFYRSTT
ncbi:hypothetical protein HNQ94_003108 [Salirhabdus euzebyi]|uniref:YitT family protein n=1 Tax=Salirhabdus euzebyi TaxID=394506 RepID=A0A841Q7R2_9BACI|nr:YitT family protein [Salirhabdus euzebyi]MBB6454619.1 hypothetical protein [Salirhabdus euzebyi]